MSTTPRTRRGLLGWAAIVALLASSVAFTGSSGATTTPMTTSLSLDCTAGLPTETIYWTPVSQDVAVTITNCTDYTEFDADYNVVDTGPATNVTLNLSNAILQLDGDGDKEFAFNPVYPQHLPAGELLTTRIFDLPLTAPTMDTGLDNSGDSEHYLGGIDTCGLATDDPEPSPHIYSTIAIEVLIGGSYTFRGIGSTPPGSYLSSLNATNEIEDPFLALYSSFDPSNPDNGVVGCNDDLNDLFGYGNTQMAEQLDGGVLMEGHQPYFTTTLSPGKYTLVLTTWSVIDSVDWASQGPGEVKFEMWGPECGLDISDDPACKASPTPDEPVGPSFTG
ncbi:MAG: hypothetical protein FGM58_08210 [Acidimicrobiia bacterium]|nr:hypothetical protein [Acidimicrobiia bacterium]